MRSGKILAAVGLLVAFSFPAHAQQQASKVELAGTYSYMRLNLSTPGGWSEGLQANGGTGSVAFNLTNSLGIVGEFGAYKTSTVSSAGGQSMKYESYLFGPRLSIRKWDTLTPYFQTLLGGVKGDNSFTVTAPGQSGTVRTDKNSFAWSAGAGLDASVSQHLAIRVFQVEYFFTKWPNGGNDRQNSFRFETGLVFRFGQK